MTTVLDQLQGANDQQRRAALAALAQGGQRGLDAYTSAQQTVGDAQSVALERARRGAQGAGLSEAAQAELASIVGQPGDRSKQQLGAAQGQYTADNAARQQSTDAYFREVNAAVPLIQQDADGKVALAKQAYEQQLAAQQADAARAQQEHDAKMQEYAARLAQINASNAAKEEKDPYTLAQKQAIAAGLADEQARNERLAQAQQEMDARIANENLAWKASMQRPMEQSVQERSSKTADRMAREDENVVAARQQAATVFNMPSLNDLALTGTKLQDQQLAQQAQSNNPYANMTADRAARELGGPNAMPQLNQGIGNLVDAVRRQASTTGGQGTQLPELTNLYDQQKQQSASFAQQLAQLSQPDQTDLQRQAYADFTGDPLGAFSIKRPDETSLLEQAIKKANLTNQANFLDQYGVTTPDQLKALQSLQDPAYSKTDEAIAKQAGIDPGALDQIRQAPEYQDLASTAQAILDNFSKTGQVPDVQGNMVDKAPSMDVMKQLLAAQYADNPQAQALIPVLLAEMQPYLYGGSYDPTYLTGQ